MKHRATRPLAMMLSALFATAVPAHAGTVGFAEVARLSVEGRRSVTPDLHLRSAHQQDAQQATASGLVAPQKGGAASTTSAQQPSGTTADASTTTTNADPLAIVQDPGTSQQGGTVETVDLGDVTGTVCDCGEIPFETPRGGIPWWPLVGIPLICVTGICTPDNPPTPPTTPTPPSVPEPATLMLFGSGLLALGAGARRRRARKTMEVEARDAEVV